MTKKIFAVTEHCTTTQTKYVLAESAEQAKEMTEHTHWAWNEKENVIESYTVVSAPEDYVPRYLETLDDEGKLTYIEDKGEQLPWATAEDVEPEIETDTDNNTYSG